MVSCWLVTGRLLLAGRFGSLNDQSKLVILFNTISSNGNYAKIEPFLQKTIATYDEPKNAVLQASILER